MDIKQIQSFLEECKRLLWEKFWTVESHTEDVLWSFTKLTEEVGELAEQINKRRGRQSAYKWSFSQEDLEDEIADVIFAASMLAVDFWVDLETLLKRKKWKIETKLK